MKRLIPIALLLLVIPVVVASQRIKSQRDNDPESFAGQRWEYLVVANPSATNFAATGNPDMRKEDAPFREGFVLETQLDKLGARGWELVSVEGTSNNPVYYFKRAK
jgi:hypothetical protein